MSLIHHIEELPIILPPLLVGRDALLQQINQTLSPEQAVLLYGASGVGKRSLAAEVASRYLAIGGKVLWLQEDDLNQLAARILFAYNINSMDLSRAAALLAQHAPLIILQSPHTVAEHFIRTYSRDHAPVILIQETALDGPWEPMLVRRLDQDASRDLLLTLTGLPPSPELERVLEYVDGHPLALHLIAAHLAFPVLSLSNLLVRLPAQRGTLQQRITGILQVLFRLLDQTSQGLLMAIGASFRSGISAALLGQLIGVAPDVTLQLAQKLLQRQWLQQRESGNTLCYTLHPIVQTLVQQQAANNQRWEEIQARFMDAVVEFTHSYAALRDPEHYEVLRLEMENIFGVASAAHAAGDTALLEQLIEALNPAETLMQEWGYQHRWKRLRDHRYLPAGESPASPSPRPSSDRLAQREAPRLEKPRPATADLTPKPEAAPAVSGSALIVRDELQLAFDQAIARRDLPEMARLSLAMGEQYATLQRPESSLHHFKQGVKLYQELGDLRHLLAALETASISSLRLDAADSADAYLLQALNISQQLQNEAARGRLLSIQGDVRLAQGAVRQALDTYKSAIKLLRTVGDRLNVAITLAKLANLYLDQARPREASVALSKAIPLFEKLQRRDLLGRALGNLGTAQGYLGHWREAGQRHAAALKIARELGDREEERFQLRNLAFVAENEDYLNWAVKYNQQALHLALQDGKAPIIREILLDLGRLLLLDPDGPAQALVLLEHAHTLGQDATTEQLLQEAQRQLAQRQRSQPPLPPAERNLRLYAAAAYPA